MIPRKPSNCAICENQNLASNCTICVNSRLNEYNISLKSLKSRRDSLYMRLSELLAAKGKADDQLNWRVLQNEKLARLKEKLRHSKEQLMQGKAKIEEMSNDLKCKYGLVESAMATLEANHVEQLEKYYYNLTCTQRLGHVAVTHERLHKQSLLIRQICRLFPLCKVSIDGDKEDGSCTHYDQICGARLPRGLDPHSVPSNELAASLGYMVQLLNLVVQILAAPALHNCGFAGSCSRIWQRDSYWDARPSSRSNEYPLFIPRQDYCSTNGENSWSDRSSSNFGVASMESERKPRLESSGSSSFNYSSASPHSLETHKDLQKGISLLKKSVACITTYGFNSLCSDVPPETTTFEALAKLLYILSSPKEVRSVLSQNMASTRSSKQVRQSNKSAGEADLIVSPSTAVEKAHTLPVMRNMKDNPTSTAASYLYAAEVSDLVRNEHLIEGWDIVERPTLPPPPSQNEDVEHWTRAMFVDATKK